MCWVDSAIGVPATALVRCLNAAPCDELKELLPSQAAAGQSTTCCMSIKQLKVRGEWSDGDLTDKAVSLGRGLLWLVCKQRDFLAVFLHHGLLVYRLGQLVAAMRLGDTPRKRGICMVPPSTPSKRQRELGQPLD